MFGLFGKGPDPAGMTCAEITKGYKLNEKLAQERSGQHKKNSEIRMTELKPFYQRCQEQAAVDPILSQAAQTQALIDQVYGGGQAGPAAMSATFASTGETFNTKSVLMLAGIAAIGLAVFFVMRKRGSK